MSRLLPVNKALAFLARDFQIQSSYRLMFALELVAFFLAIVPFYFLARFIGPSVSGQLDDYGGDYFAFVLIGIILQEYLTSPLMLFSRHIRDAQLNGTLESTLSTQTPLTQVILGSALYPFLWATFNVLLYVMLGFTVFGVRLPGANWAAAALILILALVVFCGIGILSASFILIFKRGDPMGMLISIASMVFAGVLYPVSTLPSWLRTISNILPTRYAIDGMRGALLRHATWTELWPTMGSLLIFAFLIVPFGLAAFHFANRWVRTVGSLSEY
jgi:ABC-2 type transport system permease protein